MVAPLTVTLTEKRTVNVDDKELGHALMHLAWKRCGEPDDGGCDWTTTAEGVYINGDPDWCVSRDLEVIALVDAANVLILGRILTPEAFA